MSTPAPLPNDHGEIIPRRRFRISWVWLFPMLAASAASYMFLNSWISEGPRIDIEFGTAPGMRAGKTPLYYRGVEAGIVTGVDLGQHLEKAIVHVRLKKYAQELARQGTLFWIDQPVFTLTQASGIQSLIDGNSLQAQMGSGKTASYFVGSDQIPLTPLSDSSFTIRLHAPVIPPVESGCEVSFRGLPVGHVKRKGLVLDSNQEPYMDISINKEYAGLVRANARFWTVPPWAVKMGPGTLKLDVPSLKSFVLGGIAFDYFGDRGGTVTNGTEFSLCANEAAARAISEPFILEFKNAQGLLAGESQLRYMGIPVGLVDKVTPTNGKVLVSARLHQGYEFLRRKGSVFSIVRPSLELQKVSGLETLVSGIYIDCTPGTGGAVADRFRGTAQEDADLVEYEEGGFEVILQSSSTKIMPGTAIMYRGVRVGKIISKALAAEGQRVNLKASIRKQYAGLLRENTRFWNAGGVKISGGLISLNVQASALESRALGGVEFSTPDGPAMGGPVESGHLYELYETPKKDWLNWSPSLPRP
jgi:paraquat-inducible protein B